jgi:hypothetical protein
MNRVSTLLILLVVTAGAMGYAFYRQHRAQAQFNAQLYQLDQLLTADNEDADRRTDGALKGIEAAVVKNQNQPKEVAILKTAQNLNNQADSLAQTLHELADALSRPTGSNAAANPTLAHLGNGAEAEKLLSPTSMAYRGLHQQLAEYRLALQALNPTAKPTLAAPRFAGLPVVAALASLSQLESEVRAAELNTLRYLTPKVGAKTLRSHLVALYSAESSTVAPGKTYRAQLFLGSVLELRYVPMQMRCNSQPVSVDSSSVGQVRFRAPKKPGPAAWTGTIRLATNGRDTTFRVRVSYRVARR